MCSIVVYKLQYAYTAASFKMPEQELNQHNTFRWDGPAFRVIAMTKYVSSRKLAGHL